MRALKTKIKIRLGERFGNLTVKDETPIRVVRKGYQEIHYLCLCSCGETISVHGYALRKHRSTNCGCSLRGRVRGEHPTWKGHEEISAKMFGTIRRGATQRGLSFNVSIEFLWKKYLAQDRKCSLSGIPIVFGTSKTMTSASLDRIDSNRGYEEENVQWVHKDLNLMKMHLNQDYFIEMCRKVALTHP